MLKSKTVYFENKKTDPFEFKYAKLQMCQDFFQYSPVSFRNFSNHYSFL